MIDLYACGPMSAAITQKQCAINRQTHFSCLRCAGLGALVKSVDGQMTDTPVKDVNQKKTGWGWGGDGSGPRAALDQAITQDRILGGALPIEVMDSSVLRSISFDVVDIDDLALIGRVEKIAYENGSTLGDEILLWLRVMEAEL